MLVHDHDHLADDSLRPKSRLDDDRADATTFRAAAADRTDVLGSTGLMRLQRAIGNGVVQRLATGADNPIAPVLVEGGAPLGGPLREDMEQRFGSDFSDVRIHTGDHAHGSAKAVNAHAYTVGSNIVFQRGMFDPDSHRGRTTLAHELTHVVQQRLGPVDGVPTESGYRVSDPSDRFEREASANAERIVGLPTSGLLDPTAQRAAIGSPAEVGVLQRADAPLEEEEDAVQGSFKDAELQVQREPGSGRRLRY